MSPLVANEHLTPLPFFPYFSMNHEVFDEVDKGIREKENSGCFATERTLKNEGYILYFVLLAS